MSWPGNYRRKKLQILQSMFIAMVNFLNEIGEEYWLDFGTLLGYYRENGIIGHDVDIDFSMHEKSYNRLLSESHRIPLGFKIYDTSTNHHGPKLYLSHKGFDVDIYFYQDVGETIRSYENTKYANERQFIPKRLIFPLRDAALFNLKVFVPNQTKKYLEFLYGCIEREAWRDKTTGFWKPK